MPTLHNRINGSTCATPDYVQTDPLVYQELLNCLNLLLDSAGISTHALGVAFGYRPEGAAFRAGRAFREGGQITLDRLVTVARLTCSDIRCTSDGSVEVWRAGAEGEQIRVFSSSFAKIAESETDRDSKIIAGNG